MDKLEVHTYGNMAYVSVSGEVAETILRLNREERERAQLNPTPSAPSKKPWWSSIFFWRE